MPRRIRSIACLAVAAVVVTTGGVHAQESAQNASQPTDPQSIARTDALVNQELDRPVKLDLEQQPLPDALDAITDATGVPFRVSDETYALLPYGRQTPISVRVSATPLRQTLGAITGKLGLEFVLRDEVVEIRPQPPLVRAGRRATVQEMAMLDLLANVRLDLVDDRPTAAQLLEAVDLKLQDLDSTARDANRTEPGFVVENRLPDTQRRQPVFVARNATLAEAMEAIDTQTSGTWYPWGDTLVVVPKDAWVRQMLSRPVNLSYKSVDVLQVLHELEQVAGVPFNIEPGAMQRIPEDFRRIRLFLDNATVREALDRLGAGTGLSYTTDAEGVYLWNGDSEATPSNARRGRRPRDVGGAGQNAADRPVLMVDLGDGTSLLIYADDLPESAIDRLEQRRQTVLDSLSDAGPTTRPN